MKKDILKGIADKCIRRYSYLKTMRERIQMQDLSATMYYKAKFTATANDASVDLLWTLICEVRSWLINKWNVKQHQIVKTDMRAWTRFKFGGKIFDEENTNHIYGESAYHFNEDDNTVSWACKIVEKKDPLEGYALREWTRLAHDTTL